METSALLHDGAWEVSGCSAPEGPEGTGVPEEGGSGMWGLESWGQGSEREVVRR